MTRPKRSDAYPPQFLHALRRVAETGEDLIIPSSAPSALRLTFYGLFGALRAEGNPELPSMISILISPEKDSVIIRTKDATAFALEISKALEGGISPSTESAPAETDDYEAALARILGGEK